MNKKFAPYSLVLLIVIAVTFLLSWYRREHTDEPTIVSEQASECLCPSLDELLRKELPKASIKPRRKKTLVIRRLRGLETWGSFNCSAVIPIGKPPVLVISIRSS